MEIKQPDTAVAGAVADLWVDLAHEQRAFGSHLRADANRASVREAVVRHSVAGGLLVASENDAIVGFVMFGPDAERYEQDVSRGVVRNLLVRSGRRNEGIGADLLAAAETALAGSGFDVVSLSALAENDAARRFYCREGYRPHRVTFEKRLESDSDKTERE